jgi:hypothetical protein
MLTPASGSLPFIGGRLRKPPETLRNPPQADAIPLR